MRCAHLPLASRPVPQSLLLVLAGTVFLVVTCTFGYLILDSRAQLRGESEKRFQTRAVISAAMTDSLFATASGQQQQAAAKAVRRAARGLAGARAAARQSGSGYALVLDDKGEVLGASGELPTRLRRGAPSASRHIKAALAGRPHLSGVLPGVKPGCEGDRVGAAFQDSLRPSRRSGRLENRRDQRLPRALPRAGPREQATWTRYLVDETGNVLATASGDTDKNPPAARASLRRSARPHGKYSEGGTERYFASAPVSGSSWRTVVSEPTRDLYPLLATGRTWLLWGVLAAFAATAAASLLLFRRVLRTAAQLTGANARLEARQEELGVANEQLENQTRLAQEASRAKSAFLANMSHELRTPLNAIIGFSELMMNGNEDDGERREYLGHVIASGRHLEQLVNDILDLRRWRRARWSSIPQPWTCLVWSAK